MKKKAKNKKTIMFLSAGFVCLMLGISMALFLGSSDEPIRVDALNAQSMESYNLEEQDLNDVEIPVSKLDANWNITPHYSSELKDAEVVMELSLDDSMLAQVPADAQVPEPATAALLLFGGIGMLARYRRRRG